MTETDHALLVQVLAELRQLRADLCRQRNGATAPPVSDNQLLAAIAGAVNGSVFNATDLLTAARTDRVLRTALDTNGLSSARLVRAALKRLRGRTVAGLELVRAGRDERGIVWVFGPVSAAS